MVVGLEDESAALKALREMEPRLAAALERALGELSGGGSPARLRRRAETLRGEASRLIEDIAAARAGAAGVELERVKKLWNFVFPGGMLQERRWNVLHFVARHGTAWLDEVREALHEDPLRIVHRWITFPPESPP